MEPLISPDQRCLLVAAAPKEARAVLDAFLPSQPLSDLGCPVRLNDRFDLVRSGVGKSNAASATAIALTKGSYRSVISVGIAGALPAGKPVEKPAKKPISIGHVLVATRSTFSDEGVGTPDGFLPMSDLGFAPFASGQMGVEHDQSLTALLSSIADSAGTIATVSWCSGDDGCARGVVTRTGAVAEAMEGAACAVAAEMIDPSIRTGELRVISNTTGNRANQVWDLDGALAKLTELTKVLGRLG